MIYAGRSVITYAINANITFAPAPRRTKNAEIVGKFVTRFLFSSLSLIRQHRDERERNCSSENDART